MSLEAFLAWEREQPERYEYADGVAKIRSGQTLRHNTIVMNLLAVLRTPLRAAGCRIFNGSIKIIANGSVRYPDLSITCQDIDGKDDIVPDPILVIEVLSPSTEREDRGRKKFDYFATPSIRQYAIVEQDERLVDLYTRSGDVWTNEIVAGDAVLNLSSVGVVLSLDAIYEDTDLDPTRRPAEAQRAPAS